MTLPLVITPRIREKLESKHQVSQREVEQAFENIEGTFAVDNRPNHLTDPRTQWFVSQTNKGRILKVMFVYEHGNFYIKSAYDAAEVTREIYYRRYCANKGE